MKPFASKGRGFSIFAVLRLQVRPAPWITHATARGPGGARKLSDALEVPQVLEGLEQLLDLLLAVALFNRVAHAVAGVRLGKRSCGST